MAIDAEAGSARIRITRLAHHLAPDGPAPPTDASPSGRGGERRERVVVVGASVLDVHLTCDRTTPGSTVPGTVRFQHGGVGRNIAECLGRLGERPLLVSAVGDDAPGREILEALEHRGVATRGVKVCAGRTTPAVACSFDREGNLTSGVADTELVEDELGRDWVLKFRGDIEGSKVLVLEANLGRRALEACFDIAQGAGVPVFFEPVSVSKSARVAPFLPRVAYLSPNEAELSAIAGASRGGRPPRDDDVEGNAALLLSLGVGNVVVTRGERGVYAAAGGGGAAAAVPSLEVDVVNVSGAGDCLVAGVLKALVGARDAAGLGSLDYAVSYGIAVACAAVQSPRNVPDLACGGEELEASALSVFSKRVPAGSK